ncbi:outer membrane lipoprotein Blc [Vibrio zhanjiangensis]|uniref:Outer membrane lipoprotein Blc n=1 Tax=Vibrio zhanjiangensis TaxID=1046128 RepID=A0ABQ6EZH9_9VIBR|nr:lipocalin family protein [Vibrio zhanjiangensis]GLT18407.1 outer membrane lipoprotein Blc [Vibrio zhanjiangensis]
MKNILIACVLLILSGCLGMPKSVEPVDNFELNRYLGTWYEIARLDHSFERGLSDVTAQYSLRSDGGVSVVNKGYSSKSKEWQEALGKAFFVDSPSEGYLKVSFFGPFYGSYVVFELDKENYSYAFISGPDHDYLWLLSRTPTISQTVIDKFERMSKQRGFDINNLIYVEHTSTTKSEFEHAGS